MTSYVVLGFSNENSLTPYPFTKSLGTGLDNVIVDGSFIQFDEFIPIIKQIAVDSTGINLTMTFAEGDVTVTHNYSSQDEIVRFIHEGSYLGSLTVSSIAFNSLYPYINKIIELNIPVLSSTVTHIPTTAGVYSINAKYGDVGLTTGDHMYTTVSNSAIQINAEFNSTVTAEHYLKSINSVTPTNNKLILNDNEVVKFNSRNKDAISVDLIGNNSYPVGENTITTTNA